MNNKLPEKLTLLRKYYGLSQGDIAEQLKIPVTEYMNWENGNSICAIEQLRDLAELFRVPLQALVDNTKIISVSEPAEKEQPAETTTDIPFLKGEASPAGKDGSETTEDLDLGETKLVDTQQFQETIANQIIDDPTSEESFTQVYETQPEKKRTLPKKKKRSTMVYAAIGLTACIVIGLLAILFGRGKSGGSVELSSLNRLALGDTYSIYIDKDANVEIRGTFNAADAFQDIVQVSAYDGFALGLKKDGTVVSNLSGVDLSALEGVVQIAAGKSHGAVLTRDGKVHCAGSQDGCAVEDWTNVKLLRCGNNVTIGITKDGSLLYSGNLPAELESEAGVKDAAVNDSEVVVLHQDGTLKSYPIGYGAETFAVSEWSNMASIAVGQKLAAGVTTDGNVELAMKDTDEKTSERMLKKVNKWSSIRFLAANGNTVIAVDQAGKMHGVGDNTYQQYDVDPTEEDPEEDAVQLDCVKNVSFAVTTGNLNISWDAAEHADYYVVKINTSPEKEMRVSGTTTSIPASSLKDGNTYTIDITSCANNERNYAASEVLSVSYQYNAKTIQLNSPEGLDAAINANDGSWTFTWKPVTNADYYIFTFGDEEGVKVNDPMYTITGELIAGQTFRVKVKAVSNASQYTDSQETEGQFKYEGIDFLVSIHLHDAETNESVKKFEVRSKGGIYTYNDLAGNQVPDGYELISKLDTIEIYQSTTLDIAVRKVITDEPVPEGE